MALCMAVLGMTFFSAGIEGGAVGWIAIACLALFKTCFSLSWGGIVWLMLGEIFPLKIRGTAMSIATLTNWAGNVLVAQTFPMLQAVGEGLVFFIFAAVGEIG